ncbi:hypothetical protein Zmor_022103 [Zophobas morio]|uniref:Uncharacterized protein n=1 Tax=Zophobas morio TaxID=2755281 RepID=A0AA38HK23_9CUCU|nr:hypothetical protein Zmor_022103 [Zophobas morio]
MALAAMQDDAARLGIYRIGRDAPERMAQLGFETPEEMTRFINFDFQNMTALEKGRMRTIMPFYTYFRQSFAFHLKNFSKNATRYQNYMRQLDNQYNVYASQVDPNGAPSWMMNMNYIPFAQDGGIVGVLKIQNPFQDLANITNMVGGGLLNLKGADQFERGQLKQSAVSFFGQINPLIKSVMDTMSGTSVYGDEENDSNFFKALQNEFGGVFTRIPELVKNAVEGGDSGTLESLLDQFVGMTKHYKAGSLKEQRVRELISYIEEEIENATHYVESYTRAKERMFGTTIKSTAALKRAKIVRSKKLKKKRVVYQGDDE